MTSSGRSLAPASTIMIASRVPETIEVELRLGELAVGRVDDELAVDPADADGGDGPLNGISLIVSAADAASVPRMSGSFSWSVERTVITSWMSSL